MNTGKNWNPYFDCFNEECGEYYEEGYNDGYKDGEDSAWEEIEETPEPNNVCALIKKLTGREVYHDSWGFFEVGGNSDWNNWGEYDGA